MRYKNEVHTIVDERGNFKKAKVCISCCNLVDLWSFKSYYETICNDCMTKMVEALEKSSKKVTK